MSLILDALNRSRSEQGAIPNLETVHGEPEIASAPRRRWLPWAGLVIALGVIAWLVLDRTSQRSPAAPEVRTEPVAIAPEVPRTATVKQEPEPPVVETTPAVPVAAPVEPGPAAKPSAADPDPEVAALYAEKPAVPSAPEREPASAEVPEVAPVTSPASSDSIDSGIEEQPLDIERMLLQAEDELENARLEEHSAPFLADLSQRVKDSIPTILYERHDYSGRPGVSRVVLNGQSLGVGGRTRGVRVEEILADSVVLEFQGTSFRLRALNSWVNL